MSYPVTLDVQHSIQKAAFAGSGLPGQANKANRLVVAADNLEGLDSNGYFAMTIDFDELNGPSATLAHFLWLHFTIVGLGILEVLLELFSSGVIGASCVGKELTILHEW